MKSEFPMTVTSAWYRAKLVNLYRKTQAAHVSPRGMKTHENENETFFLESIYEPVIWIPERKLSYRFMAAEAHWILSGSNRLDYHPQIREKLTRFSDDGLTLSGAYGPKIMAQTDYVINKLVEDPDTRQAVLTIWRENPRKSKDIPCTVCMQFRIRNNMLNTTVFMRSSDMYLGIPYDVFSFSCVAKFVQLAYNAETEPVYNLELGSLCIFIGSSHLYSSNFDDVHKIQEADIIPVDYDSDPHVIMEHIRSTKFFDNLKAAADAKSEEEAYWKLCRG